MLIKILIHTSLKNKEPLRGYLGIAIMANIFDTLVRYNLSWSEKSRRSLNDAELKAISKAVVSESEYGKSLCFTMVSGGVTYMPLAKTCELPVGKEVPTSDVELVTLQRIGDADIVRADVKTNA